MKQPRHTMGSNVKTSEMKNLPEIRGTYKFPENVSIVDSTIRSLQSGVSGGTHAREDLIEIGKALDELGVREQIINLHWDNGLEVCEGLKQEHLNCKIVGTLWAPHASWQELAKDGIRAGVDEICFDAIPDVEFLKKAADFVQSRGKTVSHSFGKVCSYEEVVTLCKEGIHLNYQSQSFSDSFFRFAIPPEGMKFFIESVIADVPNLPPIYIHLSNLFGHATMTTIAGLAAGATAADVCMNGIGHHGGHTSLAEVAVILEVLYGVDTGIKLEKLKEVSLFVQEKSQIPVPLVQPLIGDFAFMIDGAYWATESALPFDERVLVFPFPPNKIGGEVRVIWSDRTINFTDGVKAKLSSMGVACRQSDIDRIIERLRQVLNVRNEYPKWVLDSEFEELCKTVLANISSEL